MLIAIQLAIASDKTRSEPGQRPPDRASEAYKITNRRSIDLRRTTPRVVRPLRHVPARDNGDLRVLDTVQERCEVLPETRNPAQPLDQQAIGREPVNVLGLIP